MILAAICQPLRVGRRWIAVAALFAIILAPSAEAADFTDRVVGVADGDTITVLDGNKTQHRIRISGIDAPETRQPGGQRSKESLFTLVDDQPVRIEWQKRDRYDRIVGKVSCFDGRGRGGGVGVRGPQREGRGIVVGAIMREDRLESGVLGLSIKLSPARSFSRFRIGHRTLQLRARCISIPIVSWNAHFAEGKYEANRLLSFRSRAGGSAAFA